MFVDITKVKLVNGDPVYPPECIRVDLGFIPITVNIKGVCPPQTLVNLIEAAANAGKLLEPCNREQREQYEFGWKPVEDFGFPFSKRFWAAAGLVEGTAGPRRINHLCKALAKE